MQDFDPDMVNWRRVSRKELIKKDPSRPALSEQKLQQAFKFCSMPLTTQGLEYCLLSVRDSLNKTNRWNRRSLVKAKPYQAALWPDDTMPSIEMQPQYDNEYRVQLTHPFSLKQMYALSDIGTDEERFSSYLITATSKQYNRLMYMIAEHFGMNIVYQHDMHLNNIRKGRLTEADISLILIPKAIES